MNSATFEDTNSKNLNLWKSKDFLFWLSSRFLANLAKQMMATIVAWQVYQLSKRPLALGLIGLAEALPFIGSALFAGHVADQNEKRKIMIGSQVGYLFCALFLLIFSLNNIQGCLVIYLVMGLTGIWSSFEISSAGAYVQTIVPTSIYPQASAAHLFLFQLATIFGPLLAGWLLFVWNASFGYAMVIIFMLLSLVLVSLLRPIHPKESFIKESVFSKIRQGLRFIYSDRLIFGAMLLDMVAVLFGGAVALFPIFADLFNQGSTGLGWLRAAPALGTILLTMAFTYRPFFHQHWRAFLTSVAVFGVCMIGFALSPSFLVAIVWLVVSGIADGISVIIRQSIYQARTPDELRGRVAAVNGVFIRSSNELGAFESGLVAQAMGLVPSVVFGGVMTLVTVGLMTWGYSIKKENSTETKNRP